MILRGHDDGICLENTRIGVFEAFRHSSGYKIESERSPLTKPGRLHSVFTTTVRGKVTGAVETGGVPIGIPTGGVEMNAPPEITTLKAVFALKLRPPKLAFDELTFWIIHFPIWVKIVGFCAEEETDKIDDWKANDFGKSQPVHSGYYLAQDDQES